MIEVAYNIPTYRLTHSVFVSMRACDVLRTRGVALKCFPLVAVVTKFVADVAHVADVAVVAIVIDRKMERGQKPCYCLRIATDVQSHMESSREQ